MRKTRKKRSRTRVELERELLMPALSLVLLIIVSIIKGEVQMQQWLVTVLSILPIVTAAVSRAERQGKSR